jgi:hypothetical protein
MKLYDIYAVPESSCGVVWSRIRQVYAKPLGQPPQTLLHMSFMGPAKSGASFHHSFPLFFRLY